MLSIVKKYWYILLIFFISLACTVPIWHSGIWLTHDGEVHLARFAAYFQAFTDGQIIPRWAGNLNFTYGTPVFIFYYPLPGYLASLLHLFGLSFETSYKLLMLLGFLAPPLTFYLWARLLFRRKIAILGSLLYGLAPYHFLDLYVRGDVAEVIALAIVPLVFLFIEKLLQSFSPPTKQIKNKKKQMPVKLFAAQTLPFIFCGGFFYAIAILSHNGVSLMFSPVFLFYALLRKQNWRGFVSVCLLLGLGLLLSAFFWLPALAEAKYTNAQLFIADSYKNNFPTLLQLIYSPWGFSPGVRQIGGLSPQIGIVSLLLAIGSLFPFFRNKTQRKEIIGWWFVAAVAIFVTLPISIFLWKIIPTLRLFEFPWRFVGLISFATVVLACFSLQMIRQRVVIIIVAILFLLSIIPFLRVQSYVGRNDKFYLHYTGTTSYHGETTPIWTAGDPGHFPKTPISVLAGKGKIKNLNRKSQLHTFTITAKTAVSVLDNTTYFPGWKVMVDGQKVPIEFQDINHRGLITFHVAKGRHQVRVFFTESPVRWLADMVSLLVVVACIIVLFAMGKRKRMQYN